MPHFFAPPNRNSRGMFDKTQPFVHHPAALRDAILETSLIRWLRSLRLPTPPAKVLLSLRDDIKTAISAKTFEKRFRTSQGAQNRPISGAVGKLANILHLNFIFPSHNRFRRLFYNEQQKPTNAPALE
jgi:hypothetical protein